MFRVKIVTNKYIICSIVYIINVFIDFPASPLPPPVQTLFKQPGLKKAALALDHSHRHALDGTSVGLFVSAAEYEPPCLLFNKQQDCGCGCSVTQFNQRNPLLIF